jgi:hypothetical protein
VGIAFLIDLASHGGTYYHIYKEKPMHKSIFAIQQLDILFLIGCQILSI